MKLCVSFSAFLLVIAILFPASAAKAVTVYMSSNSDDVNKYTPPGPVSNFAHLPFGTNPEGLAFDTFGNLFVAGGGDVSKITPSGTVSLFATLPGAGGYGMAIDAGNNLYVAGAASLEIKKITPGGTVTTYATLAGGSTGLTIDGTGNLYALTGGNVVIIPPGGGSSGTYATLTGHPNIYGPAFDSSGYLYVSDITSTTLLKIPPGGGSFSNFATTLTSGPKGLVFDSNGILYAAQPNEDKISTIMPDGTASTFGTGLNGPRYIVIQSAAVSGDYNHNGVVDAADYVVWRNGLGTTYTQADYDVWRTHFGQTAGSGSGALENTAVPEPATEVMLMLALTGWCLRRGRAV